MEMEDDQPHALLFRLKPIRSSPNMTVQISSRSALALQEETWRRRVVLTQYRGDTTRPESGVNFIAPSK